MTGNHLRRRQHVTVGVRGGSRTVAVCIFVASLASTAGCDSSESGAPSHPAARAGGQVEVGYTVNYGSFGTKANIDCGDGKSLNVGGSNNTLTVTGSCWGVNIGGADNRIAFDKVTYELTVVGLNNTITYKGDDPQIRDLGSGNTVDKR